MAGRMAEPLVVLKGQIQVDLMAVTTVDMKVVLSDTKLVEVKAE